MAKNIKHTREKHFKNYYSNKNSSFSFPTNSNEINQIINDLKNDTDTDYGITVIVFKKLCKFIEKPLSFIINKCLEKGYCPEHFKKAI